MESYQPQALVDATIEKGVMKAKQTPIALLLLGIIAGVFIGLAGIALIRVNGMLPNAWGPFMGAIVFPFGLICLVLVGGELVTGDMMVVSFSLYAKKIKLKQWARTIALVSVGNIIGAIFVAFVFGHLGGAVEGSFIETTIKVANTKTSHGMLDSFISGIACNILVSTAVYLSYASKDYIGKIIGIALPILAFVLCGFQHVVANMFYIPASIFVGGNTWGDFISNIIPVYLGNFVGGAICIAGLYYLSYKVFVKPSGEQA